ncbi:MFS transporter [Gordonia zhaorongruii]|uniref:MFS transporter n=1 Tax=Gordonia zhaorongruii TaxID=2597659 RepID=UPI00104CF33B
MDGVSAHTDGVCAIPLRAGSPGYRRITLALFVAGLTTFGAMYSTQAVLPEITEVFGAAPAVAALTVSATTGLLALTIIPISALSERHGRTRVMTVSAAASVALGLLIPLAPSIGMLIALRALQGVALAGVPAVAMAYLAEEVDGRDLGAAMGRYVAGTTVGGMLGRVFVAGGLEIVTWRWALEAFAIVATVLTVVLIRMLPASEFHTPARLSVGTTVRSVIGHVKTPALAVLFTLAFLLMGGFVAVYNYLGFRLIAEPFELPAGAVGLIFLIYIAGTWSSGVAGKLADRRGPRQVLVGSILCMGTGLILTLPDNLTAVLAGAVLMTAGFFGAHSVASSWVGSLASEHRAEASSAYLFCYYVGSSVVGAAVGIIFADAGWNGLVITVGSALLVALLLAVAVLRGRRRDESPVAL